MLAALKTHLLPALRERGFTGSLPHLRRAGADRIALLTVQFDRRGGGFVVEIAACPREGVTTHWGEQIAPRRVTAHDVPPRQRHRLGSPKAGVDGRWFRYDGGVPCESVAAQVIAMLPEADAWWAERLGS
jgi:hypothetical protein